MTRHGRARLLFRVEPIPLESPIGYLCRVAQVYSYNRPHWLLQLAGLSPDKAVLEASASRLAHALRLEPEEWLAMCYRRVTRPRSCQLRSFCGKLVGGDQLNVSRPRACPSCLRERSVWWAIWDLCFVSACPTHRCLLVNQCPGCNRMLAWRRPAVETCRCGRDLRTVTAEAASAELLAMNTLVYRAAGSPGAGPELDLRVFHFPPELARLRLGPLLRLIRSLGLLGEEDKLRRKQRAFYSTDLVTAIQVDQAAAGALRDWPRAWRKMLNSMVVKKTADAAAMSLSDSFGNFYRHLFYALPRTEFRFLHEGFETFVVEDWEGVVRGGYRTVSVGTRERSIWISADQAAKKAQINFTRIGDLVRQGKLEGIFHKTRRRRHHIECWVKRVSLQQWISARDGDLAQYVSRPQTRRALGLHGATVLWIAKAGLLRYVQGSEHYFRPGFYFLREDVWKIKHAFEKHAVPVYESLVPEELIALGNAALYVGRNHGLPALIRAVVDGGLIPVARSDRFPGITGYLFLAEHVRRYRCVAGVQTPPEGFLNYTEAASRLGWTSADVIAGLMAQGVLGASAGYQRGRSRWVPASAIQRFSSKYVAVKALAQHLHVTGDWLRSHLRKSGTPTLAVPVGTGRRALFLLREVATEVRVSPPRDS